MNKTDNTKRARNSGNRGGNKKMGIHIAIGFLAVSVLIAAGILLYANSYTNRLTDHENIYPNVYVAGINIGGMTKEDAVALIKETVEYSYKNNTLNVVLPDRTLSFDPEHAKASINVDEAVELAYTYGREGSRLDQMRAYQAAERTQYHIPVDSQLEIDQAYIRSVIDQAAAEVKSSLTETKYDILEDRIEFKIGTAERSIDTDDLYDQVINAFLNNDFTTIIYNPKTVAPPQVDLDALYQQLCVEPKNAVYNKETAQITPEVVGFIFDLESERQYLAFAEDGSLYTIQFQTVMPEITQAELQALLFRDKLAGFSSTLSGSNYNRDINVTLACNEINGTVVLPGEIFSFNGTVGERTSEKGYKEATVYVSGESVQEAGGGVCQVASTIYLVTLLANLEVVEREEHQFSVTYVPPGQDATIYWPNLDYKFRNNTDYPIRINASVSGGYVNISFTGTKLDDTYVEMESKVHSETAPDYLTEDDPTLPAGETKIKQTAYTGSYVTTKRKVYSGDGTLLSDEFEDESYYNKRDQITLVGTGTAVAEPEPSEQQPSESTAATASPPVDSPIVSETPETPKITPPVSEAPGATHPLDTVPADDPPVPVDP